MCDINNVLAFKGGTKSQKEGRHTSFNIITGVVNRIGTQKVIEGSIIIRMKQQRPSTNKK